MWQFQGRSYMAYAFMEVDNWLCDRDSILGHKHVKDHFNTSVKKLDIKIHGFILRPFV